MGHVLRRKMDRLETSPYQHTLFLQGLSKCQEEEFVEALVKGMEYLVVLVGGGESEILRVTTGCSLVRQAGWLVELLSSNCINSSG